MIPDLRFQIRDFRFQTPRFVSDLPWGPMGSGGIPSITFSVAHRQPAMGNRQLLIGNLQSPITKIRDFRFEIPDWRSPIVNR
jgi:hypothetical protein